MRALGLILVVSGVLAGLTLAQEPASTPASPPQLAQPAGPVATAPAERPATEASAPAGAGAGETAPSAPETSGSLAPASSAAVSAPGPLVMLVMESGGGVRAASELRASLNQVGYRVLSPADVERQGVQPDALLTVAFSQPDATTGARSLNASYWSREGRADRLNAASLATLDQLNAVALALSSALIDRHRNDDTAQGTEALARTRWLSDPNAPGVLYAMVSGATSVAPRTNVRLRFEDF